MASTSDSNNTTDIIEEDQIRRTFKSLNLPTLSSGHSRVFVVVGDQRLSMTCAFSKGKPKYVVRFGCHPFCVSDVLPLVGPPPLLEGVVKEKRSCCVALRSIESFSYCEEPNTIDYDPWMFSDVDGQKVMRVSELFAKLFENPPRVMKGG